MPERPLYPQKRTFKQRNPESDLWMSALPPRADINGYGAGCPLLTHSGHCLVFGLRPDCLTLSRVGLPLGDDTFGFGDLVGGQLFHNGFTPRFVI